MFQIVQKVEKVKVGVVWGSGVMGGNFPPPPKPFFMKFSKLSKKSKNKSGRCLKKFFSR
jgi:hypothetical protein